MIDNRRRGVEFEYEKIGPGFASRRVMGDKRLRKPEPGNGESGKQLLRRLKFQGWSLIDKDR